MIIIMKFINYKIYNLTEIHPVIYLNTSGWCVIITTSDKLHAHMITKILTQFAELITVNLFHIADVEINSSAFLRWYGFRNSLITDNILTLYMLRTFQ